MNQPDYGVLLDDEIWAYMRRSDEFYPPDAVGLTIEDQRAVYNKMCAAFHQTHPDGVQTWDVTFGGVPCRRYEVGASDITVIYYHGGGFVVGGLDSHDDVCAEICAGTGYRVISVDYRLAPEVIFPGCFNDAYGAFEAIAAGHPGDIVLAGDSAGGNLAAAVAHYARGRVDGRIKGQVLIYPGLGGDRTRGSYVRHANAPQLTVADMEFYQQVRSGGEPPKGDPRYAPLHDTDFTGLPPSVMITAECDPLSSDGETYRDAVLAAGGQAIWVEEPGLVHGYLRARVMSQKAAVSFDRILRAISALGAGDWPAELS
ncbi:alpha/beta hydrolase [Sulfitobacter sp. CW3]|uniref:alpha/beta hydrolase n=1 Tax=Sulfitobacter sp. CW3 TaxID=2861965 RepID=UPI001C5F8BAF|nr:alpha/beta hydrolase [Sulfitobacter sp. CW3]MBW4963128.1 alpha/beta hydrolase [Sulfitobacter sp. CW3]